MRKIKSLLLTATLCFYSTTIYGGVAININSIPGYSEDELNKVIIENFSKVNEHLIDFNKHLSDSNWKFQVEGSKIVMSRDNLFVMTAATIGISVFSPVAAVATLALLSLTGGISAPLEIISKLTVRALGKKIDTYPFEIEVSDIEMYRATGFFQFRNQKENLSARIDCSVVFNLVSATIKNYKTKETKPLKAEYIIYSDCSGVKLSRGTGKKPYVKPRLLFTKNDKQKIKELIDQLEYAFYAVNIDNKVDFYKLSKKIGLEWEFENDELMIMMIPITNAWEYYYKH